MAAPMIAIVVASSGDLCRPMTRIIALQQALRHPSFVKSAIAFIRPGHMKAAGQIPAEQK
jgi:hypothetical protein